jgi:hypothetical protein
MVRVCWGCDAAKRINSHGLCNGCLSVLRRTRAECVNCGKVRQIVGRGVCEACRIKKHKPTGGKLTPEQAALVKARESEFLGRIVPAVVGVASRTFRHWSPQARAEMFAEVKALAWRDYVSMTVRGKDPLAGVRSFAELVVRKFRSFKTVAGSHSSTDPLDALCRHLGRTEVTYVAEHYVWDFFSPNRKASPVAAEVEVREELERHLTTLPANEAEALQDLVVGGKPRQVSEARKIPVRRLKELVADAIDAVAGG